MSTFVETLYEPILAEIGKQPLTSQQVADIINCNYYTTRKAMATLEKEGKIVKFDNRARNARYTLGTNNGPSIVIPELRFDNQNIKAVRIARWPDRFHQIHGSTGGGIVELLGEIFDLAQKINSGFPLATAEITLKRSRAKLQILLNSIDEMKFLGQQILDNPKFWDPTYLEKFPNDVEWDIFSEFRAENPASDD